MPQTYDKMLILGLILLIPTATFAIDYGNYGSQQSLPSYTPIDLNKDGVKPDNFIFNFEQLRRDQPPQIEMRDESMGTYMHRRPQTTTTSLPIVVSEFPKNNNPFSIFSNPPYVNNDHRYQNNPSPVQSTPMYHQYNQNPIESTPMPSPPSAPKWSDFAGTFNKQAFPHYESQKTFENSPIIRELSNFHRPQSQNSAPVDKPVEHKLPAAPGFNHFLRRPEQHSAPVETKTNHVNNDFRRNSMHHVPPQPSAAEYIRKTHEYVPMRKETESRHQQEQKANRGSHKFGWNDLVTEPSWSHHNTQQVSTAAPVVQGKSPHPIPTLTPWLDGF